MNFVKLHKDGVEILINMDTVAEIYRWGDSGKSVLYLNSVIEGEQAHIIVDESLDEIYEKLKCAKQA